MAPSLFAAAVALATVGGLLAAGLWSPWAGRFVQGVDVSRHQGDIDWRVLATTDIRFAYIKASEGADYADPMYAAHWRGAGEAGLKRGAYHFFTLCRSGLQQAANFLRTARPGELPPAVDLEQKHACARGPTMTDVPGELTAYLDAVERATGARPIIYTTREFHDAHLAAVTGERFWVRSLFRWPQFRRRDWVLWQHHNKGDRAGVQGPVDLNSFRGDDAAFAAFAAP